MRHLKLQTRALLRTRLLGLLAAWAASACTLWPAPTLPPPPPALFAHDPHFAPAPSDVLLVDPLAMSPAMRAYMAQQLQGGKAEWASRHDPRRALLTALYQSQALRLQYDDSHTRTAAQAFEQRAGNCLSLVLMTAAFAKHLGLPVSYQTVDVDEAHERRGGLHLSSGHVNIVLQRPGPSLRRGAAADDAELVVDFLPGRDLVGTRTRPVDEATVLAMFHNNRAAERLASGQLASSYWSARQAVRLAPGLVAAQNTLGVVYARAGLVESAERAYRQVLQTEPHNLAALNNLVGTLKQQGRLAEAEPLARQLARLQPLPPFQAFDEGRKAMAAMQFERAKQLFDQELQHQPHQSEVHHWAALAHWHLGNHKQAERHLAQARDYSSTTAEHGRFSAKLASLRTQVH